MTLFGNGQAGFELCNLLGLASARMETRDPSDKQVELSRPALVFLLANRDCSTSRSQHERTEDGFDCCAESPPSGER